MIARLRQRVLEDETLVHELDEDERAQLQALLTKALGPRTTSSWVELFSGRP